MDKNDFLMGVNLFIDNHQLQKRYEMVEYLNELNV
jgi:hypothetical protein